MATQTKVIGPISAYAIAVQEGYTGSKSEWAAEIGNAQENAQIAQDAAERVQNLTESLPDDFTDTIANFAPTYSTSSTYAVGDYVIHYGSLYRCITKITTAEAWTPAHWTQVNVGGEVSDLKSAVGQINDEIYYASAIEATTTASGWRLNESDGLCSSNSGYKLVKYTVKAGDIIKVISDDRFQFQSSSSVPSSGTSNRVGDTKGAGEYVLTVPENATYLIVSTPTTSNASVYATETIKDKIDEAVDAINIQTGWKNSYDETIPVNATVRFPIYATGDDIITITLSVDNSGIRANFYYRDGTSKTSVKVHTGLIYRPEKELVEIGIYNGYSSNITVSIEKTNTPLHITNYYDKAAKISGYINNGSVGTGYYHSDYIPYHLGEKIIASGYPSTFGTVRFHFYDPEKTYIGRIAATLREDGLYEVTTSLSSIDSSFSCANVAYVNFNMSTAGSDTAECYINDVPYAHVEYGQYLPEDQHLFFNKQQTDYIANSGGSPIAGKKIAYNGDSICESRLATGNTYNGGAYAKMIADLTNGTYENRAHGGGILASAPGDNGSTPSRCVVSDVTNMTDDADLICFEGGINDYWRDVPLGDYTESDYSGTLDTTTVCGALESIFRQATTKWVGKPIVFVIVHKIKSTVYAANSAGYTFAQEREKMIGICNKYAIPYYDAFAESGLNAYNDIQNTNFLTSNSTGNPDGCHPNDAAYRRYYVPQLIKLFESVMPRLAE